MSYAHGVVIVLAGVQILMGFYLLRYGLLAGVIERSIRTNRDAQAKATGRRAVGYGLFYMAIGMGLLVVAAHVLLAAFGIQARR